MALRQLMEDGNPFKDSIWKRYRKKPVVVQAFQIDPKSKGGLKIKTLEGILTASPGDFIIRGVEGEIYPCKPNIFRKTYEEVK